MSGVIDDILPDVDDILGVRDDIGAALKPVSIVTRNWSGVELGAGDASEFKTPVLPSPRVVEFAHDLRIKEGGAVKQGDILLKMISKNKYPNQSDVDFSGLPPNVEKFYDVGGKLYRPFNVVEKFLTWNVLLRPHSDQTRYE